MRSMSPPLSLGSSTRLRQRYVALQLPVARVSLSRCRPCFARIYSLTPVDCSLSPLPRFPQLTRDQLDSMTPLHAQQQQQQQQQQQHAQRSNASSAATNTTASSSAVIVENTRAKLQKLNEELKRLQ